MIHINGRPTQFLIQFADNLTASDFVRACADNGIIIAGIAHNDEETTIYFRSEDDQMLAATLV